MSRNIYLLATDGLCNRMRTIDSAITLSSKFNRKLKVIWVSNKLLNSSFSNLFNEIENIDILESTDRPKYLPGLKFNLYPKNDPATKKNSIGRIASQILWRVNKLRQNIGGSIFYNELLEITNQRFKDDTTESEKKAYDVILERIRKAIDDKSSTYIASCWRLYPDQEFYAHFTPIKELQSRVDEIANNFSYTFGLHIRRTDHKEAIEVSGIHKFVQLMEQKIRNDDRTTFFLATDDRETEDYLKKKFDGRIITSSKSSFSRDCTEGIQDAVVDLYSLSKTLKIYGSFRSSFSQVAAAISGIEVETVS